MDYVGVGNSTSKKDAQTNCARDMIQYLVRLGHVKQSEVPSAMVSPFEAYFCRITDTVENHVLFQTERIRISVIIFFNTQ